jgi:hypothetical protein
MSDTGWSETSAQDHTHECECGTWVCNDELCTPAGYLPARPLDFGPRRCPWCERE